MNGRKTFLAQQTYATLFSLTNKLQVRGDQYLGQLTSRQLMAMIAVAHLPDDQRTLNNIARKLGTTKQSIKQLIAAIEKKGYVATIPSPRDKRAVNVTFTESGKQATLECGERGLRLFEDLFKDFTTAEMETLWDLLKRLYRFDGEEQDGFEAEAPIV
jgi:DNA-binding MarR family transcriptional regulator